MLDNIVINVILSTRKKMNYKFKTKPYAHQLTALEKSWNKKEYGYFMEMGTGKTKTTIDNIGYLNLRKQLKAALIIAPKSVYSVWKKELNVHLPNMIKYSCHLFVYFLDTSKI